MSQRLSVGGFISTLSHVFVSDGFAPCQIVSMIFLWALLLLVYAKLSFLRTQIVCFGGHTLLKNSDLEQLGPNTLNQSFSWKQ